MLFLLSLLVHFFEINGTAYIAPSENIWALLNHFLVRLGIASIATICTSHETRFHMCLRTHHSIYKKTLLSRSPGDGDTDANCYGKIITSPLPTKIAPG
ncbi:hypothetical protein COCCADRAFT_91949 [Bipolaris zeicola 26-R-13]|uniref:Secreted protein n=1 Tax=Cochliobolus carbonum (strain 26-R-13) TaxID=930089 RepID=W6YU11_COCC2|nr:uncharacterized protein COCCADRAFT_91949 [Bipolaris zeicola 26-R-13]EUC35006.1 hypothetical protein COCCADRAFT_91949 [Bipolaris zeicola 26-R-13]